LKIKRKKLREKSKIFAQTSFKQKKITTDLKNIHLLWDIIEVSEIIHSLVDKEKTDDEQKQEEQNRKNILGYSEP
jgi:hypothetical protein